MDEIAGKGRKGNQGSLNEGRVMNKTANKVKEAIRFKSAIWKFEHQCFIAIKNHEAQPSDFRPDKSRAASFLNGFKNIPGKACVKRVHKNDVFVNVGD